MDITSLIDEFVKKNQRNRNKVYFKICKNVLLGSRPYSLNSQRGFSESEYLPANIKTSVTIYSSNKDTVIEMYKDLVAFLKSKGVDVPDVSFPPIPVSNSFERLMFIAKYLQDQNNRILQLPDLLWVSPRTVEEDLSRLRGYEDPIQVCGKKFFIPDVGRQRGSIQFPSTAHPLFLAENLTQILVLLKGLKKMSEDPLYEPYALQTGREIWSQLSPYAKKRIMFVLKDLMPEDYSWYETLNAESDEYHFHSEESCSRIHNEGAYVVLNCIKNGKSFCVEYDDDGKIRLYKDCVMEPGSYRADPGSIVVSCKEGQVKLQFDHVIRSAYTIEELAAL
jgi:hypothetical protein